MRKLFLTTILLASAWLLVRAGAAQETPGGIIFAKNRQFRIPFNAGPGEGRLKQLQLYVSIDQGRTWLASATAPPDQRYFRFTAERDGYLWFSVQTQDLDGRTYPATMEGAQPSLKVVVDTQPPTATLQPLPPRNGEVGVAWEIRDDNLDLSLPDAARLEYRTGNNPAWAPLNLPPGAAQFFWNPGSNGPVDVRLRVRDRAGNVNEAATVVSLTGNQGGAFNPAPPQPFEQPNPGIVGQQPQDILNGPTDAERRLVNSKKITLNYELDKVGPSGVSLVELWYTMDGRSWNKYPVRFGEEAAPKNIAFDVVGEGLYGITLVAKSGVGLGERPPQIGDRPQIWIEVDITKPQVQLHNVLVGQGMDKGKLAISWSARDKNLGNQPITLSYAESLTGPWTPIVEKQPNHGKYIWTMPEKVPYQFHVKVEAADRAGNLGEAATENLVKVDLAQPKVRILNVEPGK